MSWTSSFKVSSENPIHLRDFDPAHCLDFKKGKNLTKLLEDNREAMAQLQYNLYAESKRSLLIVLQGIDAAGKDGTIRKVFTAFNPQGCPVTSFKAPSKRELAHDYLWRVHQAVPGKGSVGIFNRSHYEDVLIVRVQKFVSEAVWSKRYDEINQFEQMLSNNGTRVLKFFLYIDPEEQKERFQARLDDPTRNWKFSKGDLDQRKLWDDYIAAYQDMLDKCSTEHAPWYVIPGNRKWFRNALVSQVVRETLEDMNPQLPAAEEGLDDIVII
jgi:PPK2 family polyphosphate:nucleotide phosphotransferase